MKEQHERAISGMDEEQAHPIAVDVGLALTGLAYRRAWQKRGRNRQTERRAPVEAGQAAIRTGSWRIACRKFE
jgi:hypothetical protein